MVKATTVPYCNECSGYVISCLGDSLPLSPTATLDLPANFDPNGRDIDGVLQEADVRTLVDTPPLDLNWDLLCDPTTFKVSRIISDSVLTVMCIPH